MQMKNIKQAVLLCYLTLLRRRLEYAAGVLGRCSRAYQIALSHVFWKLSQWECHYQTQVRRYLDANGKEQ